MIEIRDLCVGFPERTVLENVSLKFAPGKVTVLLGPNGCGKSTLLRTILGLQPKLSGQILYDGIPSENMTSRGIALKAAYMPQSRNIPNITAERMVLHGRFPYLSYPRRYGKVDYDIAKQALTNADAAELAERPLTQLSGGQRQKVYLAMALAQNTEAVFMDEPTTYLDIRHRLEVMRLSRELARRGKAVAVVLHDICLAMRTADFAAVFADGRMLRAGTAEELYASGILNKAFGVSLKRFSDGKGWQYYYDEEEF